MADQEKSQIAEMIAGMPDAIHKLDDAIARGRQMRQQVEASQTASSTTINNTCDQLKKTIEQRRKELLGNSKIIAQGKDDVLSGQMQDLKGLKDTVEFCFAQAEDAATNYTADELICVTIAVKDQVKKIIKQFEDISLDLQENDKIGTSMVIAPILQQVKALGFFPEVADPKYSYVEGAGIKLAVVGVERKLKVILMDEKNATVKDDALFQYELVYKGSNSKSVTPKGVIKQSGAKDGTAFFSFVPPEPGLYEVTILVRKSLVEQLLYQIWAHPPRDYAKLPAQPAVEFKCGGSVFGAALHPSGDLYVAEHDLNLIQVFKVDGSKKLTIGGPDNAGGELSKPVGVAIIEDTLYVASMGNHCVKMYTLSGELVGTIGKEGTGNADLKGPLGVCSDGKGHLLVVDSTNKRIQIFATNGIIYKTIPCDAIPHEVAVDVEGNIHVTQSSSKAIQVFTPAGKKLTPYNVNNTLTAPQGIAVHADGTKLIAEQPSLIRVVNAAGAEVVNRSGLNGARCVLFGYCGGVYVCDSANKRVIKY